jgi:aromatic ring-opening dioxygenase catalytic subunit (LigB family)
MREADAIGISSKREGIQRMERSMSDANDRRWPTLFIPHGGGPCFFMDPMPGLPPDLWDRMATYLRGIDASLGRRPAAILVVSGHWEETRPTVNVSARPELLFDYYGFPAETYQLTYPVDGSPALASRVRERLAAAGIESAENGSRGLDHGVFVPFKVMYPAADVPVVQLSLDAGRDPATHLEIGRALAPLRDEDVLIVGSGMSYHNLRLFFADDPVNNGAAESFDGWLNDAATADEARRWATLTGWREAPGARAAHPTPEHLLPLMVAAGAAQDDDGRRTFHDRLLGKPISGFQFG